MAVRTDPSIQQINLYMDRDHADALLALANAAGVSRSELIRRLIRDHLHGQHGE